MLEPTAGGVFLVRTRAVHLTRDLRCGDVVTLVGDNWGSACGQDREVRFVEAREGRWFAICCDGSFVDDLVWRFSPLVYSGAYEEAIVEVPLPSGSLEDMRRVLEDTKSLMRRTLRAWPLDHELVAVRVCVDYGFAVCVLWSSLSEPLVEGQGVVR